MRLFRVTAILLFGALIAPAFAADPLQQFENCTLLPATWSDGDSFPVKFPDGRTLTVRLYGVDCLEMNIEGDETNARPDFRLLAQHRG